MSQSKEEEFIGVLWLILASILYQNNVMYWKIALIFGLVCQIAAIIFAIQNRKIRKLKQSLLEKNDKS